MAGHRGRFTNTFDMKESVCKLDKNDQFVGYNQSYNLLRIRKVNDITPYSILKKSLDCCKSCKTLIE